jgi:leucine dehydrogenase
MGRTTRAGTLPRGMDRYTASLDHEEIVIRRGTRSGLYTIVAVHSTARGHSLGGCRLWAYGDSRAALRDAMRLSEGMTYKAAVAGLAQGGGKGVIMAPPGERLEGERRRHALLDFGDAVNRLEGRYVTAEDVGISVDDVAIMSEVTPHVSALPRDRGGSGDPSPWTALGVECAIRVSCERVFGTSDLADRSVSVIGLGHVGGNLAERLAADGARLFVTDVDEGKRELAERIGAAWVAPEEAHFVDVDVVAPCALGGTLDHDGVPRLRAKVIAGAANNQLADGSIDGLLAERGILWAPDFVVNAGGIVNIAVEFEDGGYSEERADERVRGIGDTLGRIYDDAESSGTTPLAAAMQLARRRVAEGRTPAPA